MRQGKKHITYDSTNQLVSAANPQTYALSVTYGDWGKIQQYGLQQTDLASSITTSQTRYYSYGSLNEGQTTFAPNNISYADGTNVNEQYGINGSLLRRETTIPNAQPNEELYRFGADGNLRLYSYDRLFYSLYGYDGGTTRTYKYSFDLNPNWVNGRLETINFNMHNAMFYPNSYLNFNANGYYTKHYYNGMERIASRLGDQNLSINVNDPELQDRKEWQDSLIRKQITEITGYEFLPVGEEQTLEDPKPMFELPQVEITGLQPSADGIYYYHPNHLGSTCYVTDENAIVQQGFLYAPFGEITNEHNSNFGNSVIPKYSFNAKELDEETEMYYYEARYYAPPVFISRDPLFEKYFWTSPYAYCANNPVKYVDPDGRAWIPTYNEVTGEYTGYQWIDPKYSYNSDGTLKDGFYEQAIFFSENGTYNPKSLKNIGSSTATVYKSDGTTETFDACTYPSDVSKYATVPAGIYTAKRGIHNGSSSSYPALKILAKINLGAPNPSHPNRDYAEGIDIHKSGINNFTGIGRDGNPVSEGCLLIDINKWNRFLNCFTYNTEISVTVSRTMSAPTNKYVKAQSIHIPILTPSFPADKTGVNVPIKF